MGMLSCTCRATSPRIMFLSVRRLTFVFAAMLLFMIPLLLLTDETHRELLNKASAGTVLKMGNYFSTHPSGRSARPRAVFTDTWTRVVTDSSNTGAAHSKSDSSLITASTTSRNQSKSSSRDLPDSVRRVGKAAMTDGIFWSDRVEQWIPSGLDPHDAMEVVRRTRSGLQKVEALDQPTSARCGKTPNAVVTMNDNRTFCAKYSQSSNYSILGELMSFHLSHLLGMDNVPPVLLSYVNVTSQSPWCDVIDAMRSLFWTPGIMVALIGWIPGLQHRESKVSMPSLVNHALKTGNPLTSEAVREHFNCTCGVYDVTCTCLRDMEQELSRVAQWGTMTVFDYITANYDRVLSSLPQPGSPIRNLRQSLQGKFWLLDNEAAFFRSYQLIHRETPAGRTLQQAHRRQLRGTCIFQGFLEHGLSELVKSGRDPAETLIEYIRMREPLFDYVMVDSTDRRMFREMFSRRVFEVAGWIARCRSLLTSTGGWLVL